MSHTFENAWIESVSYGPGPIIELELTLSSAAKPAPEIPETATLKFVAVDGFEKVQDFFDEHPEGMILRMVISPEGSKQVVSVKIDSVYADERPPTIQFECKEFLLIDE